MSRKYGLLAAALMAVTVAAMTGGAQTVDEALVPVDHPAIRYNTAPVNDRVTRLMADMKSGKVKLQPKAGPTGYLTALLAALDVKADSQILVFSKTSFQASRISPKTPRAIYFNDDVAVGYVRGSPLLEVAAMDPKQGYVFYSFDGQAKPARFDRRDVCLQCRESIGTSGIPGIMVASVYPDSDGMPAFRGAAKLTDHRTRFEERWGGWYVTGTHGAMQHLGNAVGHEPDHPEVLDTRKSLNVTSLAGRFDAKPYLSGASDIVALMTYEHQTRMSDLMIRVSWEARVLENEGAAAGPEVRARFDRDLETLATYMMFADEYELQAPVKGVSTFEKTFAARGPKDKQGRSLRDFELKTRMFQYPVSYMVYSEAFDAMPANVKSALYRRLFDVLTGKDPDPKFKRLPAAARRAAFEILRDTKTGLPAYWTAAGSVAAR